MLEKLAPWLLSRVPVRLRRAVIGSPESPSRFATLLHGFLNRTLPPPTTPLECKGPLAGYRMYIEWTQFRGFVYGTWEPQTVGSILSNVKPGMTAVDIGAHIGYYTLLLAKCVGPAGRVISFEPFPANYALLSQNIKINRLHNVHTFPHAVFSKCADVGLSSPDNGVNPGTLSVVSESHSTHLRVPAVTLDSVVRTQQLRPDFIKIDAEGAELDVLLGARKTLASIRPKMLIELHHSDGKIDVHPVPDLLTTWGYTVYWIERWPWTSHILATP